MSISSQPKKPASTFCLLSSLRVESQAKGCWLLDVLMEYLITLEAKSCSKSHPVQFHHIIHQWHSLLISTGILS
ncbi:hypothetical protein CICLE_v10023180mg [Citrus x clementina]|uniref:Uncharacterized protein n=1 Tax=Citrus clementina TaxID=85681 RepID=V4VW10_CITCL|nr:hypothetical protein CICLE_v10023180mg [Citrus x clementina]